MKTTQILVFFLIILSVGNIQNLNSQVTVGQNEPPEQYATLQIKDKTIDRTGDLDVATADKGGLLLPRVELVKKKELLPFVTQDEIDTNAQEYNDAKLLHTGLIVYNLVEDDDEELCIGLNQWDGEEWNCLQNKMGNAIAEINDCSTLKFMGQYQNDVPLNSSNYMSIELTVTKAGAYTITAMPDPENGYYFAFTGVFMATGDYTLIVPGAGTPINFTPTGESGDPIKITFNEKALDACAPLYVVIEDSSKKPIYSMLCNKTEVKGVYQLDKELDEDNFIEVTLDVDPAAAGATYIIETNTIDGIYFKGQGTLADTSPQTISLQGYGTPNSYDNKVFTISSNSVQTAETCKATVTISLATKVTYGWGYYENSAGYIMQPGQGSGKIADAKINFGTDETSTVNIVRHSETQTFNHKTLDGTSAYSPTQVKAMFDSKPEIVLVGFDLAISSGNRATIAGYMVDYLKAGGVLILALERSYMMEAFVEALYPGISVSASSLQDESRYQIGFMDDEILNGPFGDIRGLFWGNDTRGAISIAGMPEEDLIVYSRDPDGNPFMFKHKYFNLFWIGEGGVFANYNGNTGSRSGTISATSYPLAFDDTFRPTTRTNWSGGDVENGRLFGNIMAWAVKQAQFNGINTPK
ncbi:hypothetical protein LJC28_03470 [Dysgonomonas sp. OttesenSCG-928-D17]|nr:hypothetical protein [Dysgonomonas sp. OttesenSCG-928-D17]